MTKDSLLMGALCALALIATPSCLFGNVTVPLAYRSPTPADVGGVSHLGPVAEGHACSHAVLGLVAWGDGGFAKAMEHATLQAGAVAQPAAHEGTVAAPTGPVMLADVQADTSLLNVLWIYQRRCTVIHAKVVQ